MAAWEYGTDKKTADKEFESLHETSSEEIGVKWLTMNQSIVYVMEQLGMDVSDWRSRHLATRIAYYLLSEPV